jgi:thymidine kinase
MYPENPSKNFIRSGWIEVIAGGMFSGKTEELIRRVKRAKIANQQVKIFKSSVDKRYDKKLVVSHDKQKTPSETVEKAVEIIKKSEGIAVVAIDEVQFFDDEILSVCNQLANQGKRVIVAGLDMDYTGEPFGVVPKLMAMAEYVTKIHAVCVRCGNLATFSHRKSPSKDLVFLGEMEEYEPLCRNCFLLSTKEKNL